MKRILALCMAVVLLAACGAVPQEFPSSEAPEEPPALGEFAGNEPNEPEEPYEAKVYIPDGPLSVEETIEAYLAQMYRSYLTMAPVDITSILYLDEWAVKNSIVWSEMLAMRRRLINENNFCYVETEELPYTITYIDKADLTDERLEYWADIRPAREGEEYRHFVVTGESGRAYPPFLALNAQHTIRLMKIDGAWKITLHYFPGSVRKFIRSGRLKAPTEEEMLADLILEFAPSDSGLLDDMGGGIPYDGAASAEYAGRYTEQPNPDTYHVGEWLGNCANFTSQCISAGFGGRMTGTWYAGGGGGSPAWENVGFFWDWITESGEVRGHVLSGVYELRLGDMIQTEGGPYRATGGDEPGSFTHSMIVADEETLLLAQNSPACFVLYSDLVNVEARFVRPLELLE